MRGWRLRRQEAVKVSAVRCESGTKHDCRAALHVCNQRDHPLDRSLGRRRQLHSYHNGWHQGGAPLGRRERRPSGRLNDGWLRHWPNSGPLVVGYFAESQSAFAWPSVIAVSVLVLSIVALYAVNDAL